MDDLIKLPEVARRLGVSEKTARRYVKGGTLPSIFVGNAYRVREEDLERYLESARVKPGKAPASPSPQESLFNGGLEEERRTREHEDALAYLEERRVSLRRLRAFRHHAERLMHRWEAEAETLTHEELRFTLREYEGLLNADLFEARRTQRVPSLVDVAALDEAEHFDVEMLHQTVEKMRTIAVRVVGRSQVDALLAEVEKKAPEIKSAIEAGIPQAS